MATGTLSNTLLNMVPGIINTDETTRNIPTNELFDTINKIPGENNLYVDRNCTINTDETIHNIPTKELFWHD